MNKPENKPVAELGETLEKLRLPFKPQAGFVALCILCTSTFAQPVAVETRSYECRVQYDTSAELGFRSVQFLFKSKKLFQVNLDGQPAYTFHRFDSKVAVSVDSERIQIEFQKNKVLWHSNIRDRYFGEGVCIAAPVPHNQ